jgi:hypothetical protein
MGDAISMIDLLAAAPTPLLLIVLYVLHKFDVRLVRIETTLENHGNE